MRALAQAALRRRTHAPVVLFFSARTQRDLIDDQRFRSWQRHHSGFRYLRTLTRADGPPPAGRIPAILGDWSGDLYGWRVYIAGAPGFVTACATAARACGARPGLVHTEEFFTEPRASPRQRRRLVPGISLVTAEMTAEVEQLIDDLVAERPLRPVFVVPGATTADAMLDLARAVVRRAERHAVRARACGRPVGDEVLRYLNRLSDLLFVLARHAAGDAAEPASHD